MYVDAYPPPPPLKWPSLTDIVPIIAYIYLYLYLWLPVPLTAEEERKVTEAGLDLDYCPTGSRKRKSGGDGKSGKAKKARKPRKPKEPKKATEASKKKTNPAPVPAPVKPTYAAAIQGNQTASI